MNLLLALSIAATLRGYWQGSVTTPAGALEIGVSITADGATLDAPALGLLDTPLVATSQGDHVELQLLSDGTNAIATLSRKDDAQMGGQVKIGSASYPISLRRGSPPEKNYATQSVAVSNDEVKLAATLYLPKSGGPVPAVVLVAGLGPRGAAHFLADRFANRGFAVLTYDRRGVGKSSGNARASFSELADDAAAAVRVLKSRAEIDPARVGIRGQSQGAWIAPLAATRVPVAFIIATGGGGVLPWQSELYAIPARMRADGFSHAEVAEATRYMENLFEVGRSGKGWEELRAMMDGLRARGARWFGKYGSVPDSYERLRRTWEGDFSYDPRPALRAIRVPFLALVGEKDVYSPPAASLEALAANVMSSDKTLRTIKGATHDFHLLGAPLPLMSGDYLTTLTEWAATRFAPEKSGPVVSGNRINDAKVTIDVDPQLKLAGSLEIRIRDAARAERFIFVDADAAGKVRRMFIAQFETMLPEHRGTYDTKFTNPAALGPFTFQQTAGRYTFASAIAAKPGAEADLTRAFLQSKGMSVDAEMMVARFETLLTSDKRSELILFYWEDMALVSESPAEFARRAMKMFTVRR